MKHSAKALAALLRFRRLDKDNCDQESQLRLMAEAADMIEALQLDLGRALLAEKRTPPYPWCHEPAVCVLKGYCPRDPNCGE